MKFIGREQKTIQRLISKDGYQRCVIYGRRRMGKTELVRKCVLEQKSPVISQAKGKTASLMSLVKSKMAMSSLNVNTRTRH